MKKLAYGSMVFLSGAVALYAAIAYGLLPQGPPLHPEIKASFAGNAFGLHVHVFAAILALAIGPLQFSSRLRARHPVWHRWMGRIYLAVGVGVGGVSGLYMAFFAFGGVPARLGFAMLALAWLYTGWRAYAAIRAGEVEHHRAWMMRNFALAFAAVTLRLYLPMAMLAGAPFEAAYAAIAWLCWVPNLAVAHLMSKSGQIGRKSVASSYGHRSPQASAAARRPR